MPELSRFQGMVIKMLFNVRPKIMVRIQRRFRIKQIYILTIYDEITKILETLNIYRSGKKTLPEEYFLSTRVGRILSGDCTNFPPPSYTLTSLYSSPRDFANP